MPDPIDALVFYGVFVFAATLHEAAHATAALLGGDRTAYEGGQVSLDPVPHMKREPFGMVVVPLLTVFTTGWPMGWASAPYNVAWAERHPRRAAWMALAGPGANLALVLLAAAGIRAGIAMGAFEIPFSIGFGRVATAMGEGSNLAGGVAFVLSAIFTVNLVLFVLNMIPLPPLDGSAALGLVLPASIFDAYKQLAQQPIAALVGLLVVWNFFGEIFAPLFFFTVGLLYPEVTYG